MTAPSGGGPAKVRELRPSGGRGADFELWVIGLNHRTAPVELRERLAFPEEGLADVGARIIRDCGLNEAVLVSTCNRVEVVAAAPRTEDLVERVTQFLARERSLPTSSLSDHRYAHRGPHAVRHLFRVASSLDSLMVGEPQILGQLKEQFRLAADCGNAQRILRRCFDRSFSVAKRVRTETNVAGKAVSVSSAAVELARRIFDDLGDKTAMLIGAGKMSELAARHLLSHGIASVIVANRSFDRAVEMARRFGGTPVPFERLSQYLHLADIVLGSVTAAGYVVGPTQLNEALRARRRRPMFFIDLGVPRNFDPGINDLENVYLYNIDDLAKVADDHRAEREREAVRAEEIVGQEADKFWRALASSDVTPTIVALRGKLDGIRRTELERGMAALRKLDPDERRALEAMTQAIVNKILHVPVSLLKQMAQQDDGETASQVAEMVHQLFALEPEAAERVREAEPAAEPRGKSSGDGDA